ncbi:MAG: antitoxin, RHH family protein [Candidatus Omnitrophota bacterium]|nr:antitoxin, RHH family protein [Candidatus Omnitrophota bacterium]
MSTKHPRLNVVLEPPLYSAIKQLAKKDGVSLSLKARDLIRQALEYCEDLYWTKEVAAREATFSKKTALTHKQVWS